MIRLLTPAVGFLHSTSIAEGGPSKTPYVLGYMAITTPILGVVAHKDIHRNGFVRRPILGAMIAASLAQGVMYGAGRMVGHMWN